MSADNYIFVRKRADGKFGVSMRFASIYYADEIDRDDWPVEQAKYTGTSPVDEFGFAPIPDDWVEDPPVDAYGVFDTAEDALSAALRAEAEESIVEYGVSVGPGVIR